MHIRRHTAPLDYLEFYAQVVCFSELSPDLLVTGHAGEILVKVMGSRIAGQGTFSLRCLCIVDSSPSLNTDVNAEAKSRKLRM